MAQFPAWLIKPDAPNAMGSGMRRRISQQIPQHTYVKNKLFSPFATFLIDMNQGEWLQSNLLLLRRNNSAGRASQIPLKPDPHT